MKATGFLKHSEYLRASDDGEIAVSIHPKLAQKVLKTSLMPKSYKTAQRFRALSWLAAMPAAFLIGYLYSWWFTPAILLTLGAGLFYTYDQTASRYVLDYANRSELFYDIMLELGIIRYQAVA